MEKLAATRDAYGEALRSLGEDNQDIVVLDADLSIHQDKHLQRHFQIGSFNVGIAIDMMGIAAGWPIPKSGFASTSRSSPQDESTTRSANP